jgi:hypothetical protein
MKMEETECSEKSARNFPEESIQYSEHGENLKSRTSEMFMTCSKGAEVFASL